jgi:predicted O-methyltransferase YrrM
MTELTRTHVELDPRIPGFTPPKVLGFLYDCVIHAGAASAIEIGTHMGRSAFAICAALAHLGGDRRLVCVDQFSQRVSDEYFAFPPIKASLERSEPASAAYMDLTRISNKRDCFDLTLRRFPFMARYVEVVETDSRKLELDPQDRFDFCFIDGDHKFDGVKNDFEKLLPQLKASSVVVFDDVSHAFPGVAKFVAIIRNCAGIILLGREASDVAFFVESIDELSASYMEYLQLDQ